MALARLARLVRRDLAAAATRRMEEPRQLRSPGRFPGLGRMMSSSPFRSITPQRTFSAGSVINLEKAIGSKDVTSMLNSLSALQSSSEMEHIALASELVTCSESLKKQNKRFRMLTLGIVGSILLTVLGLQVILGSTSEETVALKAKHGEVKEGLCRTKESLKQKKTSNEVLEKRVAALKED